MAWVLVGDTARLKERLDEAKQEFETAAREAGFAPSVHVVGRGEQRAALSALASGSSGAPLDGVPWAPADFVLTTEVTSTIYEHLDDQERVALARRSNLWSRKIGAVLVEVSMSSNKRIEEAIDLLNAARFLEQAP
ncbi:MAG: hypothetical protein R3A78_15690 [Polyangiales bacterium]